MMKAIDLYFEDRGAGIPIILVHGFPLTHKIWDQVAVILSQSCRVIMPDMRGMGNSPATDGEYSMRLLAEDLLRLMDHLQLDKAVLAGHSMGGYVCLEFARSFKDRISGFALVASQAAPDSPEKKMGRLVSVEELNKRKGIESIVTGMLPRLSDRVDLHEEMIEIMRSASLQGVIGDLMGMAERDDAREWLPDIQVPVTVIAGANDLIVPKSNAEEMAALLPDCELVLLEKSGHMLMMEQPLETSEALLSLLRRVRP